MGSLSLMSHSLECSGVVRGASLAGRFPQHRFRASQGAPLSGVSRSLLCTAPHARRQGASPESGPTVVSATAQPSDRKSTRCSATTQRKPTTAAMTAETSATVPASANASVVDSLRRAHAKPAADRPLLSPQASADLERATPRKTNHSQAEVDYALGLDLGSPPGSVLAVHSATELDRVLDVCSNSLVVLFCKARYCRSCKYFTKKFLRVAESHPGSVFLELVCDESRESFQLMEELQVPSLPHFVMFEEGEEKYRVSSTSEETLVRAIHEAGH